MTMTKARNVGDFWYSADWLFTAGMYYVNDESLAANEKLCCVVYTPKGGIGTDSPSYCFRCFY